MSRLLSVSIPDALADEAEKLARASGKTKSEVGRDALRRHVQHERFAELQRHGRPGAGASHLFQAVSVAKVRLVRDSFSWTQHVGAVYISDFCQESLHTRPRLAQAYLELRIGDVYAIRYLVQRVIHQAQL
jgi:Arc/MetJ-type ribon-helix-helix transcriptional regulator